MRWSPEKVPGVPMRLLHSASAALVVSFAESSRSAAAAVILPGQQPLPSSGAGCVPPCLASLAVGRRAGSAGAMMARMCPTGTCLPIIWQWSPLTIPRCFPQMGLGPMRLGSIPIPPHSPLSTGSSPRRWQWAQGHCLHPSSGSNKPCGLGDLHVFPTCSSPTPRCWLFL